MRRNYRIKKNIDFIFDTRLIALLPTIFIQPWKYRPPGICVIEIRWLCFVVAIGTWEYKNQ